MAEQYAFALGRAQLKSSSRISALMAGFATISLVELIYEEKCPRWLLILLGVVTALLISVHLLSLMISTCIQPYIHNQAGKEPEDPPHLELAIYIYLSWIFSTCIGLILLLVDLGLIFYFQFRSIGYEQAGWISSSIMIVVLFAFISISCFIQRNRASHTLHRIHVKVSSLKDIISTSEENSHMTKLVEYLRMAEQYVFDLGKAQLKASSNTSALLAGFAMIALVEVKYETDSPRWLLISLGVSFMLDLFSKNSIYPENTNKIFRVVTALLVSVHLLALMMSTCIQPYMQAAKESEDSPDLSNMKFYITLSWLFSTCIGLILFLVEIGIIFYFKFRAIGFEQAGWITSAILVPVLFVFIVISCLIHRSRASHSNNRMDRKVSSLRHMIASSELSLPMMKLV